MKNSVMEFLLLKLPPFALAVTTVSAFYWGGIIDGIIMICVTYMGVISTSHLKTFLEE